jgi:8-oxo-dGTP diphosphatase
LDDGESPEEALHREILEETGLRVTVGSLVDAWVFQVTAKERVLILQYACRLNGTHGVTISHEHTESSWLRLADLNSEPLPGGYLRGIQRAVAPSRFRTSR